MKNSKILKGLTKVSVMATTSIMTFSNFAMAAGVPDPTDFNASKGKADTSGMVSLGNTALQVITTIGMAISVIFLVILGIRYIMGSVEEKAEYKKTMVAYVIGAILIFAASLIVSIIYNATSNVVI